MAIASPFRPGRVLPRMIATFSIFKSSPYLISAPGVVSRCRPIRIKAHLVGVDHLAHDLPRQVVVGLPRWTLRLRVDAKAHRKPRCESWWGSAGSLLRMCEWSPPYVKAHLLSKLGYRRETERFTWLWSKPAI